ncbi:MAG: translation initiation factor, partial [Campylobacterota bacterium]|nr:translation initiation factor [Campylobacterota bacterium]
MTEKVRVHEIAKELGITSKDIVKKALDMGIDIKSANSSVTMQEAESLMNYIMSGELAKAPKLEIKADVESASDTPKEEKTPQKEIKKSEVKTPVKNKDIQAQDSNKIEKNKEESKIELQEEEINEDDDALSSAVDPKKMMIKKSGLKIVKKKQPKPEEKSEESYFSSSPAKQATAVSSYGKISAEVLEELANKKKAKQSGASGAKKQE